MIRITVLSLIVGLFLTGCSSTPTSSTASPDTQKKAKELQESMRKDAQNNAQKKIDEMDTQLKAWQVKVDNATGEAKITLQKKHDALKVQRDKFADRASEFGKASGDAWEKLKDGLEKAGTDISDAFKKANDEFNK